MSALQTLIDMGFTENSAKKALAVSGDGGVEQAMEWLLAHANDPGINDPLAAEPGHQLEDSATNEGEKMETKEAPAAAEAAAAEGTSAEATSAEATSAEAEQDDADQQAKSIKCDDCGKLFKTPEEVEFHAVKSGHTNFSESTEDKKPLTHEEKQQKKLELEAKIRQRRKEREQEEEKERWEREKKRIQMGQEIAERKKQMQDEEIRRAVEERKRDKMEDKMARQRVKEQIERDRQARREMMAKEAGETASTAAPAPPSQPTPAPAPAQKKDYSTTRLQIRLPSGTPMVQEFKAKEALSAVRLWVSLNRSDDVPPEAPIKLCTSFPRKVFTDEDMDKPLDALGLVPSAVLMVSK